ncbi:MAG: M15 family metallopeptidase [Gemmatimonadales bacterium]|nr:M15 family metallopeptidase [Gemmatimonadales bacterium]
MFLPDSYGAAASVSGTSSNGWPASPLASAIDIVTVFVALRSGAKKIQVARKAAAALEEIVRWWDANIEPVTELGSYNYREIRGYEGKGIISNHGSGTAVDINASRHPLGASGTVSLFKRAAISAKAASLGLRWGGDYVHRKDEMHFEVASSRVRAVASAVVGSAATTGLQVWLWGSAIAGAILVTLVLVNRRKRVIMLAAPPTKTGTPPSE